jgi:hypothetical protein
LDRINQQEGLVSALWQAWCQFCKHLVCGVYSDALTASGATVTSSFSSYPIEEFLFIARELSLGRRPARVRPLRGSFEEPTWGDVSKLIPIITGMAPTNQSVLLGGFSGVDRIKELQIIRNASAHLGKDGVQSVERMRGRYTVNHFRHPSDVIFWCESVGGDVLWDIVVFEMEVISEVVIA